MTLFILKPIVWNTSGYQRPSGEHVTRGFPKDHGFGHEEWNNATSLRWTNQGTRYRTFHTEGVGNEPVDAHAGQIFVFMYASHNGLQQLVGIVGNATCLIGDRHRTKRLRLARKLRLDNLSADAWAVDRVRQAYGNRRDRFLRSWSKDLHWIPNWRCPGELFCWLDMPATLNPQELRGTKKLLTIYSRHTSIDHETARAVMLSVPVAQRTPAWHRILSEMSKVGSDVAADMRELSSRRNISATSRTALTEARLGQGRFRADLERQWNHACSVTGCSVRAVLRASHIKPWCDSSDAERLDPSNGLLLSANIDLLFDKGLISFSSRGEMLMSESLSRSDRKLLGLPQPLRMPLNEAQRRYLAYHATHILLC